MTSSTTILLCAADAGMRTAWVASLEDHPSTPTLFVTDSETDLLTVRPEAPVALVVIDRDAYPERDDALLERIREMHAGAPLVVSVPWLPVDGLDIARAIGITACVPRDYTSEQRRLAVALALSGTGHYPTGFRPRAGALPSLSPPEPPPVRQALLTPRQVDIGEWLVRGKTNFEIAKLLGLSEGAVKNHVTAIFDRLEVDNRVQAVEKLRRLDVIRARIENVEHEKGRALDWLVRHVTHVSYPAGAIIFRKGDPGEDLYYVNAGQVGLDEIDEVMSRGDIFGDIGAFAPKHLRTCTARARTPVELFRLDAGRVRRLFFEYPEFAMHVVTTIAQRVAAGRGL